MVTVAFVVSFGWRHFRSCKRLQTFLYVWVVWSLMFRFWSNWTPWYLYELVSDRILCWCTTTSVLFFVRCDVSNSMHSVFPLSQVCNQLVFLEPSCDMCQVFTEIRFNGRKWFVRCKWQYHLHTWLSGNELELQWVRHRLSGTIGDLESIPVGHCLKYTADHLLLLMLLSAFG